MRRILLIEDDDVQLRIRETVLKGAGFDVLTASRAENALTLLSSESAIDNVGLIITDHYLPGLTGVDFVRRVREMNTHVPVIVLSGLPDADTEYEGLGVVFRQKPCPPADLISLVQRTFDCAA